ncbi:MAG: hypothetical protein BWY88_00224 [Synergistetes bacterium ADurb.Bin520]|nr:MAG: hypothetical protein BWY88_00224 [Synergistetes bacterium ADurb.Bin520]
MILGHGVYHRHSQDLSQSLAVYPDPLFLGGVAHVQGHHRRKAHLQKLHHQVEAPLGGRSVHDHHAQVRVILQKVFRRHPLVGGGGPQAIDSRQIHHGDGAPGKAHLPFPALHRDPGPVPHRGPGSREDVEKAGLSRIGIARQGHHAPHVSVSSGRSVGRSGCMGPWKGGVPAPTEPRRIGAPARTPENVRKQGR